MVIRAHVQQHQAERNVVRLDVLVTGARIGEGGGGLPVDHVPRRLGQEHAAHVPTPSRIVVPIELIDGDVGGCVGGGRHGAWAHNLLLYEGGAKGAERPKGETKRPEGAERKTLAPKLEDSKVIDLSELILPAP